MGWQRRKDRRKALDLMYDTLYNGVMGKKKKSGKARMGRPSLGRDARRIPITVRVSANELNAWRKAAKAARMSLGSYLLAPRREELERREQGG